MRRVGLHLAVLCLIVLTVTSSDLVLATTPTGMNIILIESDSMDGRVMGCAGHPAAFTPNMDKLAARGTLFKNTYCSSPQCCPSRASMRSGRHTHQVEGWNNYKGLEDSSLTFHERLKTYGYRTASFGKVDYLSGAHSLGARVFAWTRSADIPLPQHDRPVAHISEQDTYRFHRDWKQIGESVDWLKTESKKSDKPFFLYCGTNIPHPSFRTSKHWFDKIDPAKITVPPYEKDLHPVMSYMSATKDTLGHFTEQQIRDIRRTYYAMIAEFDAMVGEIVQTVESLGLTEKTWIIYLSDHGEMNMEHRQYLKNTMHEGSARVPLIIAGPGIKQGLVVKDLVSLVDMYPTLMDMAGVAHPDWLVGHSLMPLMKGLPSERPDWVLSQYHSNMANTGIFMLRRGPWKYIAYAGYEPQLFNLDTDPDEMQNLAKTRSAVAAKMDADLRAIVDYEAVDAKVKAYDKASFRKWRAGFTPEEYRKTMDRIYKVADWTEEQDRKIEQWLANRK